MQRIADQLENESGECVLRRAALFSWFNQLLDRLTRLQARIHAEQGMIDSEYIVWKAQV